MFRIETHLHTSETSACAVSSAYEMVKAHQEAGYDAMIVTDHFFNGNTTVPSNLPWKQCVDLFCRGYDNAVLAAQGSEFRVFFGWEYGYHSTDLLTYGLDKDYLLAHPELMSWPLEKYFEEVHRAGGFISHAHPFRKAEYIRKIRLLPEWVDAVEVENKSHMNPLFDELALEFAQKHNLYRTYGSDTHIAEALRGGGMVFPEPLNSIHDFINAVKAGTHIQGIL